MEGKLPNNGSGHILELKLNPKIVIVWGLLPQPTTTFGVRWLHQKRMLGKSTLYRKLLPFNVKKITFTRS